jgi:putative PEP-CTERM system histidine kinase
MAFMFHLVASTIAIFLAVTYTAYVLLRQRRNLNTLAVAAGLLCFSLLEIFDFLALENPDNYLAWKKLSLICESLLPLFWFAFCATFAGSYRSAGVPRLARFFLLLTPAFLLFALVVDLDRFYISPDFGEEPLLFLGQAGYAFYLGLLLAFTFCLVQLERTFAGLGRSDRWRVKFEMLGVGTILAMSVFYYSQGLLYRSLDMSLLPARSLAMAIGVSLMLFSRICRGMPTGLQVSKTLAYRSMVIAAVGIYLIGLGLAGEGMRYLGASSQRTFFAAVALLGGVALCVVLLSETLRRKVRVFLHKNFYKAKYDYRKHWLEFTEALTAARDEHALHLAILESYGDAFSIRGAALFLRQGEGGDFRCAAVHELSPMGDIRKGSLLVDYLEQHRWVYCREERPDVLSDTPAVLAHHEIQFGVPLLFEETLEGFILLGPPIDPGELFMYEDFDLMKVMARQAASALLNLKFAEQLSTAREMAAIGKVSAFVMHDLKNSVSNLALVVENARNYMADPEFQKDMLETLDNSVQRMKGLIERLKNFEKKTRLELADCELSALVAATVAEVPKKGITVAGEPTNCLVDRSEVAKVVQNLLLNALEATAGNGPVHLEVGGDGMAYIRCSDQGCGMSAEFIRERLFKPFATTKKKGFGIGLYQCRQIVEAHGGRIEVKSEVGEGTEFTVWLPKGKNLDFTTEDTEGTEKGLSNLGSNSVVSG